MTDKHIKRLAPYFQHRSPYLMMKGLNIKGYTYKDIYILDYNGVTYWIKKCHKTPWKVQEPRSKYWTLVLKQFVSFLWNRQIMHHSWMNDHRHYLWKDPRVLQWLFQTLDLYSAQCLSLNKSFVCSEKWVTSNKSLFEKMLNSHF